MLNYAVLIGRLEDKLEEDKRRFNIITTSDFKNNEGEYDTYTIPIITSEKMSKKVREYCTKNDLLGVKGRVVTDPDNLNSIIIVADRVTFLSSKKDEIDDVERGEE